MGYNWQLRKMKTKVLVVLALMALSMVFTACEGSNHTSSHSTYYDAPARR